MNMLDKEVDFKYIPVTNLKLGKHQLYFVGEREQYYTEIITYRDLYSDKWVAYFIFGDEICGFMTCGYRNLHIYMYEAMRKLMMPTASQLKGVAGDPSLIVNRILHIKSGIECGRPGLLNVPSVLRAEFTREREKLEEFRSGIRERIAEEDKKNKKKMSKLKAKFDREGVEHVDDAGNIGRDGQ